MSVPILIANWKMYKTGEEAAAFIAYLCGRGLPADKRILIAPPFTALEAACLAAQGSGLEVGGQNLYPEEGGAFTGEVSPGMLRAAGASFVILGHSERRRLFGEQDSFIRSKIGAALRHQLTPVLCLGESLEQKSLGETEVVVTKCLESCLEGFSAQELSSLLLAYEPVWAIGTGQSASADDAARVHVLCRTWLGKRFGKAFADRVPILYGGSVTSENLPLFLAREEVQGALIGGASLDERRFAELIQL